MEKLYSFFPFSNSVQPGDIKSLLLSIVIYVVADIVVGILSSILGKIPLINILTGIAAALVGLYLLVGVVLSIIKFFKK